MFEGMDKIIFIDTETTGLTPKHGIYQISGEIEINGWIMEKFDFKVAPFSNDIIDEKALEIGDVKKDEILRYEPPKEVYKKFVHMLLKYVSKYDSKDKLFFVAYNAKFDFDMMRSFFGKNGDKYFGSYFWFPYIDIMTISMVMLAGERKSMENFKLATVAKKMGIDIDEEKFHDAMYDIETTKLIFEKFVFEARQSRALKKKGL